ncbi:MAG: hypothetical protein HUK21_06060 [Fibrobacteraceae bacterium]|nr:hypothetical protein [Fibrobacteraceae bacterium]
MNKHFYCFILFVLLCGNSLVFAQDKVFANERENVVVEDSRENAIVDSVPIYRKLMESESEEESYTANVVGIVVGGGVSAVATYFLIGGISALNEPEDESFGDAMNRLGGGLLITASAGLYCVGLPILIYNIYQYNVQKKHSRKWHEYYDALKRYKENQIIQESFSPKIQILPFLDFDKMGGGLSTIISF